MTFELTILGSNSAKPVFDRHPSAQALQIDNQIYLIDCGEGTQMQLTRYGVRNGKINHIFISHLHGDHYLGLIPLLDSFALNSRTATLHLYAPPDLKRAIDLHYDISNGKLPYELAFHPTQDKQAQLILDSNRLQVYSFPLQHGRLPCTGFLFAEKKLPRRIIAHKIAQYQIPFTQINDIKNGADFTTSDGTIIPHAELTTENRVPYSYAYCSDTAYTETILPHIAGVDLLYHESTYLHDLAQKALERGHSTAQQAAQIALKAGAKRLIIGHYSSKYADLQPFENEARAVFPFTDLAIEGKCFVIGGV
jgi:ribonuclease Z